MIVIILLSPKVIIAIFKVLLNTVPVNILIDKNIVLHWHCCKSHNLSTTAIICTDFSQSIHCQFFILVHVQFVTKIVNMVRIRIGLPGSVGIFLWTWYRGETIDKAFPMRLSPADISQLAIYPFTIFLPHVGPTLNKTHQELNMIYFNCL